MRREVLLILSMVSLAFVGCITVEDLERDSMYAGPKPAHLMTLEAARCTGLELSAPVNLTTLEQEVRPGFTLEREEGEGTGWIQLHILTCREITGDLTLDQLQMASMTLRGEADVESPGPQNYLLSLAVQPAGLAQLLADNEVPAVPLEGMLLELHKTHDIVDEAGGWVQAQDVAYAYNGTAVSIETEVWPSDRLWLPGNEPGLRLTMVHETDRLGGIVARVTPEDGTLLDTLFQGRDEHASGRFTESSLTLEVEA
ncbi:MAG: hypothetical protein R3185_06220, partial [Candidatus Thermoplasmatota archaeon]|nr:hypothetical protein [Candidatus Thermoplasmatota archaeon]